MIKCKTISSHCHVAGLFGRPFNVYRKQQDSLLELYIMCLFLGWWVRVKHIRVGMIAKHSIDVFTILSADCKLKFCFVFVGVVVFCCCCRWCQTGFFGSVQHKLVSSFVDLGFSSQTTNRPFILDQNNAKCCTTLFHTKYRCQTIFCSAYHRWSEDYCFCATGQTMEQI